MSGRERGIPARVDALPAHVRRGAVELGAYTSTEPRVRAERMAMVHAAFPEGTRIQGRTNEVGVEPVLLVATTGTALNRQLAEHGRGPLPIILPAKGNVDALRRILHEEYPDERDRANIYLSQAHGDATASIRFDPRRGFLEHLGDIRRNHGLVQDQLAAVEDEGFTAVSLNGDEKHFERAPKLVTINTGSPVEIAASGTAVDVFPRAWSHIPPIMEEFESLYTAEQLADAARFMPVALDTLDRMGIMSRTRLHTVETLGFFQKGLVRPYQEEFLAPLTPPIKEAKPSSGNVVIDKENGLIFTQTENGKQIQEFDKGSKVAYLNISFSFMAKGEAERLVHQLQSMGVVVLGPSWLHQEIPSIVPSAPDVFYQKDREDHSVVDFIVARPGLGIIYHSLLAEVPGLYFSDITNKEDPEILANKRSVEAHGIGVALDTTAQGVSEMQLRDALTRLPEFRANIKQLQENTYRYGNIPEGMGGPDIIAGQIMRKELATVEGQMERFLHPEAIGIRMPRTSQELYGVLDGDIVDFWVKGAVVRDRYPLTAKKMDDIYHTAEAEYLADPTNEEARTAYLRAIGLTGAYNYIRGMEVIKTDGSVDRDVAPKMMLSPSAALQLHEVAQITERDRVLDLFCGGGYSTFALGAANPARLDAVDSYTIHNYRLNETMERAYDMIYVNVPDPLRPPITMPTFIDDDCVRLPEFGGHFAKAAGFAEHYDKIFMHPPYGRESTRMHPSMTEGDAFILWINSLRSVNQANKGDASVFSIVPEEWHGAAQAIIEGSTVQNAIAGMYDRLRGIRYYSFPENGPKLSDPVHYERANGWSADELRNLFGDSETHLLEETGMFGLHLHKINLR